MPHLSRMLRRIAVALAAGLLFVSPAAAWQVLEGDGSKGALSWIGSFTDVHRAIASGRALLDGQAVVRTLLRGRLRANAIGEPSVVMLRRSALNSVGLFNHELVQLTDFDLWLRMALHYDIAFDP